MKNDRKHARTRMRAHPHIYIYIYKLSSYCLRSSDYQQPFPSSLGIFLRLREQLVPPSLVLTVLWSGWYRFFHWSPGFWVPSESQQPKFVWQAQLYIQLFVSFPFLLLSFYTLWVLPTRFSWWAFIGSKSPLVFKTRSIFWLISTMLLSGWSRFFLRFPMLSIGLLHSHIHEYGHVQNGHIMFITIEHIKNIGISEFENT